MCHACDYLLMGGKNMFGVKCMIKIHLHQASILLQGSHFLALFLHVIVCSLFVIFF